jgi:antitoxin HicB
MTEISYIDLPYTKILRRDEDGDTVATIEELDGCIAHGSDEAEALQNLREAQAAWIEAARDAGQAIPVPAPEEELPSGKFVVRLPRSLHLKLTKLAKKDDVSLNQLVLMAVAEHVKGREVHATMSILHAWRPTKPVKWDSRQTMPAALGGYLERLKTSGASANEVMDDPHTVVGVRGRKG